MMLLAAPRGTAERRAALLGGAARDLGRAPAPPPGSTLCRIALGRASAMTAATHLARRVRASSLRGPRKAGGTMAAVAIPGVARSRAERAGR